MLYRVFSLLDIFFGCVIWLEFENDEMFYDEYRVDIVYLERVQGIDRIDYMIKEDGLWEEQEVQKDRMQKEQMWGLDRRYNMVIYQYLYKVFWR